MKLLFFAFLLILALPLPSFAITVPTGAMGFIPHRAVYDVSLAESRSGSQLANISGRMTYEWQPSCEGWISNHSFNLVYDYIDSGPVRITSRFSTFEPFDGQGFQFASLRRRDGQIYEEMRGQALVETDQGGMASFSKPDALTYDLPEGTRFPMHHTMDVLEHIRGGGRFFNAVIFDGSDQDGPVEVNAVTGNPVTKLSALENPDAVLDPKLLKGRAWSMRLAFFPLEDDTETADYEMDVVLHENSVVSEMRIDYEDFSVRQNIVELTQLESLCAGE